MGDCTAVPCWTLQRLIESRREILGDEIGEGRKEKSEEKKERGTLGKGRRKSVKLE